MDELHVDKKDGMCVMSYSGELTLEITPQLKKKIEESLDDGGCDLLVMNLSETIFLDSSGIGFLVALNNKIKQEGRKFYLYRPSPQVRKTLSLVKLITYFDILENEGELTAIAPV